MGNWSSHVGSPAIYPVTYDIVKDFEPVARLPIAPTLIVGKKALPANNLAELVAWLKANPDKATAGTIGAGSPSHVSGHHLPKRDRHPLPVRALSGRRPADAGAGGGADRHAGGAEASQTLRIVRSGEIKAFAVMAKTRYAVVARRPDHRRGRGRGDGIFRSGTACGRRRARPRTSSPSSMPRSSRRRLADPTSCESASPLRHDHSRTRATHAGGTRRVSPGRDRQVVADHQGGQHQGGMNARSEWRVANRLPSYSLLATATRYSLTSGTPGRRRSSGRSARCA